MSGSKEWTPLDTEHLEEILEDDSDTEPEDSGDAAGSSGDEMPHSSSSGTLAFHDISTGEVLTGWVVCNGDYHTGAPQENESPLSDNSLYAKVRSPVSCVCRAVVVREPSGHLKYMVARTAAADLVFLSALYASRLKGKSYQPVQRLAAMSLRVHKGGKPAVLKGAAAQIFGTGMIYNSALADEVLKTHKSQRDGKKVDSKRKVDQSSGTRTAKKIKIEPITDAASPSVVAAAHVPASARGEIDAGNVTVVKGTFGSGTSQQVFSFSFR